MSSPAPVRINMLTTAKWQVFRLLERLSDLRSNTAAGHLRLAAPSLARQAVWVFVSTIGELNAIDPFLRQLSARLDKLQLVLITDHAHYRDSYAARYPSAEICVTRGHGDDARTLARHFPPRLLVVGEIPCLPSDAPCRFSFAFVLEARRHAAPAMLVNGWLYHYQPSCRMDTIERALFQRDYLRAFDMICVQTPDCRDVLVAAGARPECVTVAGNLKFDSMQRSTWSAADARSPRLLRSLIDSARPAIVAGCVTNESEQRTVLDAFAELRRLHSDALLVLAPRHPEVVERMTALQELIASRGWCGRFRSSHGDVELAPGVDCLVLDTIGDLRDFYAAATIAHVGVDHNVLEPLAFEKPVSVVPGWDRTYPSYPVYRLLSNEGALLEAGEPTALAAHWHESIVRSRRDEGNHLARQALERARGAVQRHFEAIESCLVAAGATAT
jgi:3-deoxy-D-manno-octulosonic-acid transferase